MTGFDYGKFFAENYGLNVTVLNDAHAALLAEVYYGAAAHYTDRRVAMLTLGSGVGGGYAVCGHIVADQTKRLRALRAYLPRGRRFAMHLRQAWLC